MFDLLTVTELDELADVLCNSIKDIKNENPFEFRLLWEIQDIEHVVWHHRCLKTKCRCLHAHVGVYASV